MRVISHVSKYTTHRLGFLYASQPGFDGQLLQHKLRVLHGQSCPGPSISTRHSIVADLLYAGCLLPQTMKPFGQTTPVSVRRSRDVLTNKPGVNTPVMLG